MSSDTSTVHVDDDHGIRTITIDRPDVRNAVDRPTADLLEEAFVSFDADDALDVAILTGSNGTFCAGADLGGVADGRGNRLQANGPGPMGPTRLALSKPTLAAVEGFAVAGGLELALWCDLRVAATNAVFGVYCRRWGVPLIDGGTVRLGRLIGHSHAMDLILTGRGVTGDEAVQMGLVNRSVKPGDALTQATALAHQLQRFPQQCLRSDRQSALTQWGLSEHEAMAQEFTLGMATIESGETLAGAMRFVAGHGRHGSFPD